ncbi:MAG: hypothetical protein DSY90_08585 [Deltaproteobacteria bacterium]|nr:MAG: hypothetical protein DSY90_08585 [Deltaproteobacteria bacterium]
MARGGMFDKPRIDSGLYLRHYNESHLDQMARYSRLKINRKVKCRNGNVRFVIMSTPVMIRREFVRFAMFPGIRLRP